MIGMSTILAIKQRSAHGDSVAQIAREEGISEPTVRKYRDMDDFSPRVRPRKRRGSKLDPFKPTIDRWLSDDRKRRPKQRHTARRVFDRLVAECGYDGSYTIVQTYVKKRKAELKGAKDEFLNLEWAPGEAQVDFGVCDFRVLGVMREAHYLVVTFPFSNVSLAQCFWGETSECVCESLKTVFEFCGGVPTRLLFDNATGVGKDHYLKGEPERQLFMEDCVAMADLPVKPFRVAKKGAAPLRNGETRKKLVVKS